MDEIFDGWHKKAEYDYGGLYFEEWWRQDVTDFIYRDRNHPCVILWSIGNETGREDIFGITELFHRLDPTRKVTGGEVCFGVDFLVIYQFRQKIAPGLIDKLLARVIINGKIRG